MTCLIDVLLVFLDSKLLLLIVFFFSNKKKIVTGVLGFDLMNLELVVVNFL